MTDLIAVVVVVAIVSAAARYIIRAKKSGARCIGCSVEGGCSHSHKQSESSSCGCGSEASGCCCHTEKK